MIIEFTKESITQLTTPTLVRRYRDLHIQGSHRLLTQRDADEMTAVVDELRSRRVLD